MFHTLSDVSSDPETTRRPHGRKETHLTALTEEGKEETCPCVTLAFRPSKSKSHKKKDEPMQNSDKTRVFLLCTHATLMAVPSKMHPSLKKHKYDIFFVNEHHSPCSCLNEEVYPNPSQKAEKKHWLTLLSNHFTQRRETGISLSAPL